MAIKSTSGAHSSSWCQDLQGQWHPSGVKITNYQQHRLAECRNGAWIDYDTCPTEFGSGYRLTNTRNCWSACYQVWPQNCNTWCSCTYVGTRQSSVKKLGSAGPAAQVTQEIQASSSNRATSVEVATVVQVAGLTVVQVTDVTVEPKGNGHGTTREMLLTTNDGIVNYCQALDGLLYKPGTEITDNSLPYGLHRLSVCQPNGFWFDYDTCPTDAGRDYRLENARKCWEKCTSIWHNECNDWCSCERIEPLVYERTHKLGSSGPGANNADVQLAGQQDLGSNFWLFPGTEGAACWFDVYCFGDLECRSLLGAGRGVYECVRPSYPAPAPVPVIDWGNRPSPVPAPVPVPFGNGRRRASDALRRLQEQMDN